MDKTPEQLFEEFQYLAQSVVNSFVRKSNVPLKQIPKRVLFQAALIGLWQASKRYKSGLGCSFKTFAGFRILGAVIDECRSAKWRSRTKEENVLVVDLQPHDTKTYSNFCIDRSMPEFSTVHREFDYCDTRDAFEFFVRTLRPRERIFARLRWIDGLTQKQVGEKIGVSESGACLIEKRIVARLKLIVSKQK